MSTTVTFLQPASWPEALEARAARPEALAIAGGTDVLVELNFERRHPDALLDLSRLEELRAIGREDGQVRIGAGVTYEALIAGVAAELPALAVAARTVGSPPIRNRGTIGGNLGTASPAGDCHPPLLASGAEIELASATASRTVPVDEFFLAPKTSVLRADELISSVWVPVADGPQAFAKVGTRNAMVIAVCALAVALHPQTRSVGTGIGSAGPVPLRALAAEEFIAAHLAEIDGWELRPPLGEAVVRRFGELVAESARPIDDVRGSAAYRRHALGVLGRRLLSWCWEEYRSGQGASR
jgi:CO/xanthine dehydrogenase FAD-binding subunit